MSVDEIHELQAAGEDAQLEDIQLFIDPIICIDCGACEPECPVEAIFPSEEAVPDKWKSFIDKNAEFFA
jgi:NAD-dependent dihydropyrimidine dehydrogenase PreA subunit